MMSLKVKYIIVSIFIAITAYFVSVLKYDETSIDIGNLAALQDIPLLIGNWQGRDLFLEDKVYRILETKKIIHRNYTMENGDNVLLSIVHYDDTKVDFHAPESCLGGLGQSVTKDVRTVTINTKLKSIQVAELLSQDHNIKLLSYYFYKTGDYFEQNYLYTRLIIAYNKLFNNNSSASLIRITTSINSSKEKSREILDAFLKNAIPLIISSV